MDEVIKLHERIKDKISQEDFIDKVEKKVESMGGLVNAETAAMLILSEYEENTSRPQSDSYDNQSYEYTPIEISAITVDSGKVGIIGKIISMGGVKEFARSDGSTGRVSNMSVADSTGQIRVTLWDSATELISEDKLHAGDTVKVGGYTKEGNAGVEVHVGQYGVLAPSDEIIDAKINYTKIADIKNGMSGINTLGKLLDPGKTRTFTRRNGEEGQVRNAVIGDETGKMRVTLWGETSALMDDCDVGDSIEIINSYAKENDYTETIELQASAQTTINKSDSTIIHDEDIIRIEDITINESVSIIGSVSGIDEVREIKRTDGQIIKVANMHISDNTGRIKITLWGEHADILNDVDIGTNVKITDGYAKEGYGEEAVEVSVGMSSRIDVIK
ncbi:MAG: replication factor A [Methanosarcinales archaeon]|nr:replication factor A [Methanosarcinales archaeon]